MSSAPRRRPHPLARLGPLLGLLCLFSIDALPAHARSPDLWSENKAATTPLAQVPNFSALAKRVVPAVVSVHVVIAPDQAVGDWWGGRPRDYRNNSIGSGFVIRADGLILTNNHVVERAQSIEVSFAQGSTRMAAEVVGVAPRYDIALLRTSKKARAQVVLLGDSDALHIGEWVMAVGNPFGLSHSISVGIVSAKERRNISPEGRTGLYDFIQTDASINPGNSGGPLVNMRGEVVGINTAVQSGHGIGFAIPINMVKALLPELKSRGSYTRSYIGLKVQPVTERVAAAHGLEHPRGALIVRVIPAGPAAAAGLQEKDIVLEFEGKAIAHSRDLALLVSMAGVGQEVSMRLWRHARLISRTVRLAAAPRPGEKEGAAATGKGLGLTIADNSDALRKKYRLRHSRGIVVTRVRSDSLAARVGFLVGDHLESFNDAPILSAALFSQAVGKIASGAGMRLKVRRGDRSVYIGLTKP